MSFEATGTFSPNKILTRDLFLSFQFSQGRQHTQARYFDLLTYQYHQLYPHSVEPLILAAQSLNAAAKRLRTPVDHVDLSRYGKPEDSTETTVRKQFQKQAIIFQERIKKTPRTSQSYATAIQLSSMVMIGMDKEYIKKGRPGNKRDPHESLYREYVLTKRDVGSVAFNAILSDMNNTAPDHKGEDYMEELIERWEETHPDQSFFLPQGH